MAAREMMTVAESPNRLCLRIGLAWHWSGDSGR